MGDPLKQLLDIHRVHHNRTRGHPTMNNYQRDFHTEVTAALAAITNKSEAARMTDTHRIRIRSAWVAGKTAAAVANNIADGFTADSGDRFLA
jgi:hypothetical protein